MLVGQLMVMLADMTPSRASSLPQEYAVDSGLAVGRSNGFGGTFCILVILDLALLSLL
jgi:hypothetical protein